MTELDGFRKQIETEERWRDWMAEVKDSPPLKFKGEWNLFIIPPVNGVMTRFFVEKGSKSVSVYLDCLERKGSVGSPYYEVFQTEGVVNNKSPKRFLINETKELIDCLSDILDR